MVKAILKTNKKLLKVRNGEEVIVCKRLSSLDCGPKQLYKIRFKDGFETIVFKKELKKI